MSMQRLSTSATLSAVLEAILAVGIPPAWADGSKLRRTFFRPGPMSIDTVLLPLVLLSSDMVITAFAEVVSMCGSLSSSSSGDAKRTRLDEGHGGPMEPRRFTGAEFKGESNSELIIIEVQ
jgi:hypothetical protein